MNPKRIALVAHDNKKTDLIEWVKLNEKRLNNCEIFTTGTTGRLLKEKTQLTVHVLKSGPLGGDQQIGALIAEEKVDILIFFWDPLQPLPHDPDIKALLRIAVVYNIPFACNRSTADMLFSSPLLFGEYNRTIPDFEEYNNRKIGSN